MAKWIIVVDDDASNLQIAGKILSRNNMRVTALRSGKALLGYIADNGAPDLILLDIKMPEMDGFETIKRLRSMEGAAADIPVIFLTADESAEAESTGLSLGAMDFIKKPFVPEVLLLRVRHTIELTTLQRSLSSEVERKSRENRELFIHVVKSLADAIDAKDTYTNVQARNDTLGGSMVYPYWHPGGRFCAFSTNKTAQIFHMGNNKRIEVYDTSSDVFVYDVKNRIAIKDTLLMRKDWAENTPVFSPDGKYLYFITTPCRNYPVDYDKVKYSLCRVAFDENTGKIGEQVDTLVNADTTGKSLTWPRPSYDDRYLMYTQLDYGYFSVWHPEADLYLLDLQTGKSRAMDEVNSQRSESLHNWSRNSHWFLFTSRRDDGLYTRLYFSSIDEQGRATKPFLLPQRNPKEYYRRLMYSYNTPDFSSGPVDVEAREMGTKLESPSRMTIQVGKSYIPKSI